jgi:hypothetical protein
MSFVAILFYDAKRGSWSPGRTHRGRAARLGM